MEEQNGFGHGGTDRLVRVSLSVFYWNFLCWNVKGTDTLAAVTGSELSSERCGGVLGGPGDKTSEDFSRRCEYFCCCYFVHFLFMVNDEYNMIIVIMVIVIKMMTSSSLSSSSLSSSSSSSSSP